jgi:uncharacterized membrane protein YgcG
MNTRRNNKNKSKSRIILLISVIFFFFPIITSLSISSGWTTNDITMEYNKRNSNIFDPKNYLTKEHAESINDIINQIKSDKNYETFLFMINKMHLSYSKNIEEYLNELSYHILKGDEQRDHNSIFILYSIGDRQSRIRTGKNVRDILSDSVCLELQEEIKSLMRSGDYSQAMENLFKNLKIDVSGKYNFQRLYNKIYNFLETVLFFFIVVVVIFIIAYFTKKDHRSAEERLKKIKKICESKKPRRQIIETTCVICLEPLENLSDKNSAGDNHGSESSVAEPVEIIELPGDEKDKIEKESLLEDKKNKDDVNKKDEKDYVAKLECGHSFHSKCIVEWMAKQNKCPVCRENIDKEEAEEPSKNENTTTSTNSQTNSQTLMSLHLFNIQSSIDRSLLDYDIYHNTNAFSWNRRVESSSSSGESSSWGACSGGASSSW